MTFEEIQKTIEGMLAVQRDLQESQIKLYQNQANHDEVLTRLEAGYERQQKLIDKLLAYTLDTNANMDEQLKALENRVLRIENREN